MKPIRGGIPIAFPQFASQGPLPQHGFARTSLWSLEASGDGTATLLLRDNEETRAAWPHAFELRLRIQFDDAHLTTHLEVTHPKQGAAEQQPLDFEALQHSYFYLGSGEDALSHARVHGLQVRPCLSAQREGRKAGTAPVFCTTTTVSKRMISVCICKQPVLPPWASVIMNNVAGRHFLGQASGRGGFQGGGAAAGIGRGN